MIFKRRRAAALKYDSDKDQAPKLVAKGAGLVADKIIERAKQNNVYIKEDKDLVEVLSRLDIYEEIPEELYKVVAELLGELYKINKDLK